MFLIMCLGAERAHGVSVKPSAANAPCIVPLFINKANTHRKQTKGMVHDRCLFVGTPHHTKLSLYNSLNDKRWTPSHSPCR